MSETGPDPLAQWVEARRWFAKAAEDLQMAQLAMGVAIALTQPAA